MDSNRLAGAYLFVGPPGVGKNFTAIQFVKALNCLEMEADSCDRCTNCRLIDQARFPDLFIPARQGRRIVKGSTATDKGKGYLIDIVSRLHFPPLMGRYKVVLLDPADGLTDEAGNMLLKTLEEPPSSTLFILVTTVERAVLPTIVSRCQRLRFPPLSEENIRQYLEANAQLPAELAGALAKAAQGSIERALELNESKTLARKLEIVDFLLSLFDSPLPVRVDRTLRLLESIGERERDAVNKIGRIAPMLARDILGSASGLDRDMMLFSEREREIGTVAGHLQRRGALRFAALVTEFCAGLERNENPKHVMYYFGNSAFELGRAGGEQQQAPRYIRR